MPMPFPGFSLPPLRVIVIALSMTLCAALACIGGLAQLLFAGLTLAQRGVSWTGFDTVTLMLALPILAIVATAWATPLMKTMRGTSSLLAVSYGIQVLLIFASGNDGTLVWRGLVPLTAGLSLMFSATTVAKLMWGPHRIIPTDKTWSGWPHLP